MQIPQLKNAAILFSGQIVVKFANFFKQILLAYFLGVSSDIDLYLAAQIVPAILSSMIAGGAGEILVTSLKKNDTVNHILIVIFTFCVSIITILISVIYFFSIPLWEQVFDISNESLSLFSTLSLLVVINKFPTSLISTLKPLLFYKNLYQYFFITSLISELIGITALIILVNHYGIIAFAWGTLISSSLNAILFFNIHGLSFKYIITKNYWTSERIELIALMKKLISLSMQTLVNQLSTFWERTLSMRYLAPGYLSALNYSKSLSEMPKTIMLSSILTTTYIEQVKYKSDSDISFVNYTNKMEGLLSKLTYVFQVLSVLFAPLLIILLLRRGKFDNNALIDTLIIYQILTIGFLPGLMMNFFSRTMYIIGKFKELFLFISAKFIIEFLIMVFLIRKVPQAIPIALVVGKLFISVALFAYISKLYPGIFNLRRFVIIYTTVIVFTVIITILNQILVTHLIAKSTTQVFLMYLPIIGLVLLLLYLYLNKLGIIGILKNKFYKNLL